MTRHTMQSHVRQLCLRPLRRHSRTAKVVSHAQKGVTHTSAGSHCNVSPPCPAAGATCVGGKGPSTRYNVMGVVDFTRAKGVIRLVRDALVNLLIPAVSSTQHFPWVLPRVSRP